MKIFSGKLNKVLIVAFLVVSLPFLVAAWREVLDCRKLKVVTIEPLNSNEAVTITGIKATPVSDDSAGTITLTAADSGKVFINDDAAAEYDLPADPTGLLFHFIVGSSNWLLADPNSTDQIYGTGTAGDYIGCKSAGYTLTLFGISTSKWVILESFPARTASPIGNADTTVWVEQ